MEDSFQNWKICECIGTGAFGKVYRIVRTDYGHTYESALKVLEIPQHSSEVETVRHEGLSEADVTSYFEGIVKDIVNEFVLMSKLKGNSHIVSYEDHEVIKKKDSFGWDIYIRMELLTPLYDYIQQQSMTASEVVKMGIHLCKALELCRSNHIIHRDIKPENIFVSNNGDFKLGDFGIAKELEKTCGDFSMKGTKSYMAPEVYKGMEYDYTVDIYSLGIVLYRCLNNNRLPFYPAAPNPITYSDKENAALLRMSGKEMPDPCNASGKLSRIVRKACAYIPSERYSSAREMREDLEKIYKSMCTDEKISTKKKHTIHIPMQQTTSRKILHTTNAQTGALGEDFYSQEETIQLMENTDPSMSDSIIKSGFEEHTVLLEENNSKLEETKKRKIKLLIGLVVGGLAIAVGIGGVWLKQESTSRKLEMNQKVQVESKNQAEQLEKTPFSENPTETPVITGTPLVTPRVHEVPDTVGMTTETATKMLERQGLQISVVENYHASTDKGKVYRQSLEKGTRVQEGQKITIYVSMGAKAQKKTVESQTLPEPTEKTTTMDTGTKATEKPVVKATEKPVIQTTKKPKRNSTSEKDSIETIEKKDDDSIQVEELNPSDDNTQTVEWKMD